MCTLKCKNNVTISLLDLDYEETENLISSVK